MYIQRETVLVSCVTDVAFGQTDELSAPQHAEHDDDHGSENDDVDDEALDDDDNESVDLNDDDDDDVNVIGSACG